MIVLDEQLHDERLFVAIRTWYPGQVVSTTDLRPGTVIKDDAIPTPLAPASRATFVTINVADFWQRVPARRSYGIVGVEVAQERVRELPELLRQLLRLPEFATRSARMGKVVRARPRLIEWYGIDGEVRSLIWPVA